MPVCLDQVDTVELVHWLMASLGCSRLGVSNWMARGGAGVSKTVKLLRCKHKNFNLCEFKTKVLMGQLLD